MKRIIISFVVVAAIAISAVVVTSCSNAQARGGGSAQSVRWEYTVFRVDRIEYFGDNDNDGVRAQRDLSSINQLGSEGWEMVGTYGSGNRGVFLFKRPVK